jgi:tetratricopeptide (TPR) repeat protein
MSILSTEDTKDALQPNEREVDLDAVWRRVRGWIYAALGMALGVCIALAAYYHFQSEAAATELAAQSMLIQAPSEAALEIVVSKYPESDAAIQASMLLGYRKFSQSDWKGARESYQRVYEKAATRHPDLAASGLFGVGVSYEAEKNFDKSLESYAQLIRLYPKSFKAIEAKLGEARVFELKNDTAKAIRAYENIMVSHPRSQWKSEAEQRKKIIESRNK